MTETQPQGAAAAQMPQAHLLAHFVRDLSFENVGAVEGTPAKGTPDIKVTVNLDANHTGEDRYQVNMKLNAKAVTGGSTRFVVELDYTGIFALQNVPETHVHPMTFIECPRQIFPFARRVISDVTRDGGYPPLLLDTIDFATLYRQKLEQLRQQQQQPAAAEAAKDEKKAKSKPN